MLLNFYFTWVWMIYFNANIHTSILMVWSVWLIIIVFCCIFCIRSLSCAQCCLFLWIVHSWLPLWFSSNNLTMQFYYLVTFLGHWPPHDLRVFFVFSSEFVSLLQSICCTIFWQWHLILIICEQGGQSPGWHLSSGHLCEHPSGRAFSQASSHWLQLSPACI